MCTIHWRISKINNTQEDNAKYLDVVVPMYNLIEYNNNHSKASGSLWQYYRNMPEEDNAATADSESFISKGKVTRKTPDNGNTKDVEIAVPLKYLSNFWRTLEMPLIYCKINLILNCSANCVITNPTGAGTFSVTDNKTLCSGCNFIN